MPVSASPAFDTVKTQAGCDVLDRLLTETGRDGSSAPYLALSQLIPIAFRLQTNPDMADALKANWPLRHLKLTDLGPDQNRLLGVLRNSTVLPIMERASRGSKAAVLDFILKSPAFSTLFLGLTTREAEAESKLPRAVGEVQDWDHSHTEKFPTSGRATLRFVGATLLAINPLLGAADVVSLVVQRSDTLAEVRWGYLNRLCETLNECGVGPRDPLVSLLTAALVQSSLRQSLINQARQLRTFFAGSPEVARQRIVSRNPIIDTESAARFLRAYKLEAIATKEVRNLQDQISPIPEVARMISSLLLLRTQPLRGFGVTTAETIAAGIRKNTVAALTSGKPEAVAQRFVEVCLGLPHSMSHGALPPPLRRNPFFPRTSIACAYACGLVRAETAVGVLKRAFGAKKNDWIPVFDDELKQYKAVVDRETKKQTGGTTSIDDATRITLRALNKVRLHLGRWDYSFIPSKPSARPPKPQGLSPVKPVELTPPPEVAKWGKEIGRTFTEKIGGTTRTLTIVGVTRRPGQYVFKVATIVDGSTWLLLTAEQLERASSEKRLSAVLDVDAVKLRRPPGGMILDDARATATVQVNLHRRLREGDIELELTSIKGSTHSHQVLISVRSGPAAGATYYRPAMYAAFCLESGLWKKVGKEKAARAG